MASIMHGRRAGNSRSAPGPIKSNIHPDGKSTGMCLPDGTDLREVAVLSRDDFERMQNAINRREQEQDRIRKHQDDRADLRFRSKEKIKLWTNTIDGHRKAKLEARSIREAKEEEIKKQVDIEHVKYQAQQRKEHIEKAKTKQYYQTDRVKNFHTALMLTEVLHERKAQIELTKLKNMSRNAQDEEFEDQVRRDRELGMLQDQDFAQKKIERQKDIEAFQKAQIKQHVKQNQDQKREEYLEGIELQKLATQHAREKERLYAIQNSEGNKLRVDNFQQRDDTRRLNEIRMKQEEEEDEECRIFAAAKRKMMKLRVKKEKQIYAEKQGRLDRIRDKLSNEMKRAMDDEDDRILRAVEEKEKKRDAEEKGKADWLAAAYVDIARHRKEVMDEHERVEIADRKRALEEMQVKIKADEMYRVNEGEKGMRRIREKKNMEGELLVQSKERRAREAKMKADQLAFELANRRNEEVEERQFQEYAKTVIDKARSGGRDTLVLKRAANKGIGGGQGPTFEGKGEVRPSYQSADGSGVQLPHFQSSTTNEAKEMTNGKSSSTKRLGFNYV